MQKICIGVTGEYPAHSWPVKPDEVGNFVCTECQQIANGMEFCWLSHHWMSGCCDPREMRWRADEAYKANYGDS